MRSGAIALLLLLSAAAIVAAGGHGNSNDTDTGSVASSAADAGSVASTGDAVPSHDTADTGSAASSAGAVGTGSAASTGHAVPVHDGCASSHYMCNDTCVSCPEFSWSPAGSTKASACSCWHGYVAQSDGSCAPVSSGGNNGGHGGSGTVTNSTCNPEACVQDCPESHYSSTGTWDCTNKHSTCKKCPSYSWSPAGSDSKKDCVCWAGYERSSKGGACKPVVAPPTSVDGGWCPASECSATCGGGVQTRECACPAPSGGGAACSGEATVSCASCSCSDAPSGSVPCPESTYSASGMYVSDVSECTACPAFSWSPAGSRAITDCGCWDRYTGPAGGPCTFITGDFNGGWCPWLACDSRCGSGIKTRVCGCPYQSGNGTACEGESSGACDSLPACGGTQPVATPCSAASSASECSSWQGCAPVSGYECGSKEWSSYLGCATQEESNSCTKQATCAVDSKSGARAWLPSTLLPPGYVATTAMGGVSCCKPQNCSSTMPLPGSGHGGNGGSAGNHSSGDVNVTIPGISTGGCTWQLGGACVVLQFRGSCPDLSDLASLEAWAVGLFADLQATLAQLNSTQLAALKQQVGTQVSALLSGVNLQQVAAVLSQYVTIVSPPTANNGTGTGTYSVVVQLAGYSVSLPYTPEQVVAVIQAVLSSGWLAGTDVASQLQGVASYALMSNVVAASPTTAAASGADGLMHASLMLVLATGVVGTVVAKMASFMQ